MPKDTVTQVKEAVAGMVSGLSPKKFSTGSDGFSRQGKVAVGEDRYQVNILVVRIGSKPTA